MDVLMKEGFDDMEHEREAEALVMGPTISVERIDALSDRLTQIHIAVAEAQLDLADASSAVEETKAKIVGDGYADGTIDGSNKQTRDAQEASLLASSEAVAQAKLAVREAKRALAQQQATLAGTEARISLYRGFLYSHARMPR